MHRVFARWLFVIALAFTTPALHDAFDDFVTVECCDDDCNDAGTPCSPLCAHCHCAGVRSVTAPKQLALSLAVAEHVELAEARGVQPASATLDPPFRPPVS